MAYTYVGRRQLNNLRTLIETKGVTKEGGARTEAAMRGLRAKRDADEAGTHSLDFISRMLTVSGR
jgi:hypothetical protein